MAGPAATTLTFLDSLLPAAAAAGPGGQVAAGGRDKGQENSGSCWLKFTRAASRASPAALASVRPQPLRLTATHTLSPYLKFVDFQPLLMPAAGLGNDWFVLRGVNDTGRPTNQFDMDLIFVCGTMASGRRLESGYPRRRLSLTTRSSRQPPA